MEEMAQSEKLQANPACERGEAGRLALLCKLLLDLFDWLARCDLWSAGMNRQQLARRNKQRPLASDLVLRSWQMALLCWRILLAGQLRLRCLLLDQRGKIQSQRETERKRLTDNFHLVLLVWFSAVSFDNSQVVARWKQNSAISIVFPAFYFRRTELAKVGL